jgi:hypothetical protein
VVVYVPASSVWPPHHPYITHIASFCKAGVSFTRLGSSRFFLFQLAADFRCGILQSPAFPLFLGFHIVGTCRASSTLPAFGYQRLDLVRQQRTRPTGPRTPYLLPFHFSSSLDQLASGFWHLDESPQPASPAGKQS